MLDKLRHRLVSKTYLSALLLGAITAIEMNNQFLSSFFPEEYRPFLLMIWPVTMMTLREMTNAELGSSKEEDANNTTT